MNNDNNLILLNFILLLEGLENYIQKTNHFPNFARQLKNITIPQEVERRSTLNNSEELFKTKLLLFSGIRGNDLPNDTKKELQTKYYQWLSVTGINTNNCPKKLKHFLLEIMDVIVSDSKKVYHEMKGNLYRKKEKPFTAQEYAKVFSEVGNIMQSPPQLPSADTIKGNSEVGKEIFEKIAKSVSDSDRQNFHFYPPLTDEERTDFEKKESEKYQKEPLLEGLKISAIAEIKTALSQPLSISIEELAVKNQDWEEQINEAQKILEIENIKQQVLGNIQVIWEKQWSEEIPPANNHKLWIILGIVGAVLISLVVWLETRKKKVNLPY